MHWLSALSVAALLATPTAGPPRHLLLVTLDTTRADALGVYGGEADTPALDALARGGVRWRRALAAAPLTLPSHASLMTGLTPPAHGVRDNATDSLAPDIPSLATVLSGHGFHTVAVVGSRVLDRRFGLAHGFDVYDDRMAAEDRGEYGYPERRADAAVDAALARLASRPPGQRLFLWLHLYDPHAPYAAPGPHDQPRKTSARASERQRYLDEIAFCDQQLARLMPALPPDTLVAVVGDHGEALGEHGEDTHGIFLYDAALHVPLLVTGPGVPRGTNIADTVASRRLAHSLLHLLGLDGAALPGPVLPGLGPAASEPQDGQIVYSESLLPESAYGWSPLYAVTEGSVRYVDAPRPELYDLATDPAESRNLVADRPEVAARLKGRIEVELARAAPRRQAPLDAETREQLAALGYLSGSSAPTPREGAIDPKDGLALLRRFEQANELRSLGNLDGALALLTEILAENPDNGPVRTRLADAHLAAGHPDRALELFREAVERRPDFEFARFQLASALLNLGRSEEGKAELERVLAIDPRFAEAWLALAELAQRRGDHGAELGVLERAAESGTDSAAVFVRLGMKLASGSAAEPARAAELLRRATDAQPNWDLPWLIRGQILLQQGNASEARTCLQQASRLAPPSSPVGAEARRLLAGMG